MTILTIPEGVTALPSGLLSSCYVLEEIYIPASLTDTWIADALPQYGRLSRVHVAEGNPEYVDQNGMLFERRNPNDILYFPPMWGSSYDIPSGVTKFYGGDFAEKTRLVTITIPRGITELPKGMFYHCTALERISLPITLKRIDQEVFRDCFMLTGITLPQGLEKIGSHAFTNCPGITEILLPDSVTTIGAYAFDEDIVIYASEESAGYWYAWEHGLLWAMPGGIPGKVSRPTREYPTAVVNNSNTDDTLNLYAGPSETHAILGEYPNGTTAEILGTEGAWSHVRLGDGTEGHMLCEYLFLMENFQTQEINWGRCKQSTPVYIYSYPMEDAPCKPIEWNVTMHIDEVFGVWYKVVYENKPGYVLCQNFEITNNKKFRYDYDGPQYAVVTNPSQHEQVHLYKKPYAKAESFGRYVNGTQVEVVGSPGEGWLQVRVDGKEGYMIERFLTLIQRGMAIRWENQ